MMYKKAFWAVPAYMFIALMLAVSGGVLADADMEVDATGYGLIEITDKTSQDIAPEIGVDELDEVIHTIPSPTIGTHAITYDGEYLWVGPCWEYLLYQISPEDGSVVHTIPTDFHKPFGMTWADGHLWVVANDMATIYELDPVDGTVLSSHSTPGEPGHTYPTGLAWDGTNFWHNDPGAIIGDEDYNFTFKMDAGFNILETNDAYGLFPSGLTWDGNYLWTSDNITDQIHQVNTDTWTILQTIDAPGGNYPNGLAWDGQYLWVANNQTDMLYQYDVGMAGPPLTITAVPWNDPTWVGPNGGSFSWDVTIENISGAEYTFDGWTEVILPNGTNYGPLSLYTGLSLDAGDILSASPLQSVPGYAPGGIYTYIARVGQYPVADAEDTFDFAKLPIPPAPAAFGMDDMTGWELTGWFDGEDDEFAAAVIPTEFAVEDAYPNPFNPTTTIAVALPQAAGLEITVYNVVGQLVNVVADGRFAEGYHSFTFDASGLSSGIYFIQATVPGKMNEMKKVVLMK